MSAMATLTDTTEMCSGMMMMRMMAAVVMATMITLILGSTDTGSAPMNTGTNSTMTLRVGHLIPWTLDWKIGPSVGSAIIVGLDEVRRRGLLPGYDVEWTWRDTGCKPKLGFQQAVELWGMYEDGLDAVIGAGCSVVCQPVSLLTAAWNIPTVSFGCASLLLSDKDVYPTFSRTVGVYTGLAEEYDALMDAFNWSRVAIISVNDDLWRTTAEATKAVMEANNKTVYYRMITSTVAGESIVPEALAAQQSVVRQIKHEAFIIILLMYGSDIRNFLITCYDEQMLTGGYVFFSTDMLNLVGQSSTYRPELGDELFIGLINSQPKRADGRVWDEFAWRVLEAFSDPAFDGYSHLNTSNSIEEVDSYAGIIHDAVLLWAYGVNRTLEAGGSPDNGTAITQNILDFSFDGISGRVDINEFGDRKADKTLDIIQPYGSVVSLFHWRASQRHLEKVYEADDWSGIYWSGNLTTVPAGEPACGWGNRHCDTTDSNRMVASIAIYPAILLLGLLLFILLFLSYRQRKRRLEMEETLKYFVKSSEILVPSTKSGSFRDFHSNISISLGTNHPPGKFTSIQRKQHPLQNKLMVFEDLSLLTSQNTPGWCGDRSIVVRPYKWTPRSLDRYLLNEVKELTKLSHENLNGFRAICVEARCVYVVMDYADRGSLQDFLNNSEFSLTWDIKLSLATDIARGLRYLHQSSLVAHGHVTSTNCVVDRRLTCRVSDFGLWLVRKQERESSGDNEDECLKLLWTAPELLRENVPQRNQQKCDVYSFGIIVQELITEGAPYSTNTPTMTSSEIVSRVHRGELPAYRPAIQHLSCPRGWRELALASWEENPELRPSFSSILLLITEINGGHLPNLVDGMINRLEKHTRYLEQVVEERSQELYEEKTKVETVLCELLPASIAEQLKRGKAVEPEVFDCVTIFFSDIVGFTRVAAQSTPMQVVAMLNLLYSLLDDVLSRYDVYKVATIGDAYLVASGLPERNGDRHAVEVATMALSFLSAISGFRVAHRPSLQLHMRIGVHTGPCVAAITGIKMPRYLLFGETIDTGARIEAGGEAMRVHISAHTVKVIQRSSEGGNFDLEPRGSFAVKGRGAIVTYWLNGHRPQDVLQNETAWNSVS